MLKAQAPAPPQVKFPAPEEVIQTVVSTTELATLLTVLTIERNAKREFLSSLRATDDLPLEIVPVDPAPISVGEDLYQCAYAVRLKRPLTKSVSSCVVQLLNAKKECVRVFQLEVKRRPAVYPVPESLDGFVKFGSGGFQRTIRFEVCDSGAKSEKPSVTFLKSDATWLRVEPESALDAAKSGSVVGCYVVKIDASAIPPGISKAQIRFGTTAKDVPEIMVPVRVNAYKESRISSH